MESNAEHLSRTTISPSHALNTRSANTAPLSSPSRAGTVPDPLDDSDEPPVDQMELDAMASQYIDFGPDNEHDAVAPADPSNNVFDSDFSDAPLDRSPTPPPPRPLLRRSTRSIVVNPPTPSTVPAAKKGL